MGYLVEPPFYYQNLTGPMYVLQPGADGIPTLSQPMSPDARAIHMGDITEFATWAKENMPASVRV